MTHRKILDHWTEVHRVVDDEVKVTTCCCVAPGYGRLECAVAAGFRTPCRCFCHSKDLPRGQGEVSSAR